MSDIEKRAASAAAICNTARVLFGGAACRILRVRCARYRPKSEPFLLLCNHTGELDPCFVTIAVGRYMRFVMSDHLLRTSAVFSLITRLAYPILLHRGMDKGDVAAEIKASLAAGINVAMFPEANGISAAGRTGFIPGRTGQLVKETTGSLITMRVVGGGLRRPRWSRGRRNGVERFSVVREYSRAELDGMGADAINAAICRDLYVDEYEEQRRAPHEYEGRALCEYVERILFLCPACGGIGLHSESDRLICDSCGRTVVMDKRGFFENSTDGLDNPGAWEQWQRAAWKAYVESAPAKEPITEDEGQILKSVASGRARVLGERCRVSLYKDRLEINGERTATTFFLNKIDRMTTVRRDDLIISYGEKLYELCSSKPRSALKYLSAYYILTGREYK